MGALHEGHLSLVRAARKRSDRVVVSIFVNPIQFGPQEDFRKYPRTLVRDLRLLRKERVDVIFLPSVYEMYPKGPRSTVEPGPLAKKLCGRFRPGHFAGVATIVLRLCAAVRPDVAFFGQKDYQQQLIIKWLCKTHELPIRIVDLPTVREADGLAMSSRNKYLSQSERHESATLYRALRRGQRMIHFGECRAHRIRSAIRDALEGIQGSRIDYVSVSDPRTLAENSKISGPTLLAAAVWIGKVRLIDNLLASPPPL